MKHHLVLRIMTKMLLPPILLFALYVQFHGDLGPGGGFQAGVIAGATIILYGLVFGLEVAEQAVPPRFVRALMAAGVLVYAGTGLVSLARGGQFLDYDLLAVDDPIQGQHLGIMLIEIGVFLTVSSTMIAIFYAFAGRPPRMSDEEW